MMYDIFGKPEQESAFEFLRCPLDCDYTRSGDRTREKFKCRYCKHALVNDAEYTMIQDGTMPLPKVRK